jgi:hypothetical protein
MREELRTILATFATCSLCHLYRLYHLYRMYPLYLMEKRMMRVAAVNCQKPQVC